MGGKGKWLSVGLRGEKVNWRSGKVQPKRGRAKGKGLNPFFLSGGPKDAGQTGKKREVWRGLGR